MIRFIDREHQMHLLEKAWDSDSPQFIVIYGRRRIGKTRLITEFIEEKDGVFYIAEDENPKSQRMELKEHIASYLDDDFLNSNEFDSWKDLFEYLKKVLPKEKRFYLAIDEFSYMVRNEKSIVSTLQKFWDTFLSKTKICLILSGSLFGLMEEKVLSNSSPLYGRRTRDILLQHMTFEDSTEFLEMTFEDKIKTYMSIGGVPEYLLKARDHDEYNDFVKNEFLNKDGYFYREPYFILSQEFKTIKTYFSMIDAISKGNTRPTEIANHCGIESRNIYPYLENLIRLSFVERQVPITLENRSGIYHIKDVFFDFWFNFVHRYREKIERDLTIHDEDDYNTYFGKRFESLIRDELFHHFFDYPSVGRWWYKSNEIDIVAVDEEKDQIMFGECKWSDDVNTRSLYYKLKEKKDEVRWNDENRKEEFVLFARSFKNDFSADDLTCIDLSKIEEALNR